MSWAGPGRKVRGAERGVRTLRSLDTVEREGCIGTMTEFHHGVSHGARSTAREIERDRETGRADGKR
jgi:hypothetical protein